MQTAYVFNGELALFAELLKMFVRDDLALVFKLKDYFKCNKHEAASKIAHKRKGLASYIGVLEFENVVE